MNFKYISPFRFLILLFFVLATLGIQAQDQDEKAKLAMNSFLDAEKNKMLENYQEAIKLYEKTLEIDAEYDPAMFELGRILLYQQKYTEALHWIEKAYQLDSKNKWYALLLIDLYRNNIQIDEAVEVYQSLLIDEPTNTDYLINLSTLYSQLEDYDKACNTIEKVEKLNGIAEQTSFQKRQLYLQQDKFDKAVHEMILLSNTFPEEETYCSMIAEMYMQNQQAAEALEWYEKVLKINPNNPYIQITLADYYSKMGDFEKAYEYLKEGYSNTNLDIDTKIQVLVTYFNASNTHTILKPRAFELAEILIDTHPEEPKSHAIYGDLLFRDSLYAEASNEFIRVIELDSTRYPVWEQLLYSLSMQNKNEEMASYGQRAIDLFPEMEFPYYVTAIANFQLERTKEGIAILEKGLYFVSNDQLLEQFYMFLGDAYHEDGQTEKAYESYEKCLQINPSNSFVLNNFAYYLSLEGNELDKAEKMAHRAVQSDPNANNLDTYGWVLFKQAKYDEAKKYILQSVELSEEPSDVVLEHLGDTNYKLGDHRAAKSYWRKAKKAGGKSEILMKKIKDGKWYDEEK
ncbi:MAG: tetratricopeptide repeat protein [Bacteroidales bacterium]|nr:tetratricopeptide repeat protein [Bacteroidales bacterium]